MLKRRVIKLVLVALAIFFLGGIGGFVFDKYFAPYLSSCKLFSGNEFFQKNGKNTTIIRETERVVVKDDNSINEIASSAAQSVVDIVAIAEKTNSSSVATLQVTGKKGTGTILTNDGVVVTHIESVIDEDASYSVTVFDGSTFEAELVAVDDFSELAFLKIDGANLPAVPFANSDDVIIGKKAIALGSSLEENQVSITEGILSDYDNRFNLAGVVASSEKLEGVFRSNFKENDNYVGAPIIDYNGELVAITSVIKVDNERKYFHIPANKVKKIMSSIFSEESSERAKLGVYYVSIDRFYAKINNLSVDKGALVYSPSGSQGLAVIANSAASKAGIKVGDIITSFNQEEINLRNSLSSYVNKYKAGDNVDIEIIRDGEKLTLPIFFNS
jgi:S1-C subfamily serine protease